MSRKIVFDNRSNDISFFEINFKKMKLNLFEYMAAFPVNIFHNCLDIFLNSVWSTIRISGHINSVRSAIRISGHINVHKKNKQIAKFKYWKRSYGKLIQVERSNGKLIQVEPWFADPNISHQLNIYSSGSVFPVLNNSKSL